MTKLFRDHCSDYTYVKLKFIILVMKVLDSKLLRFAVSKLKIYNCVVPFCSSSSNINIPYNISYSRFTEFKGKPNTTISDLILNSSNEYDPNSYEAYFKLANIAKELKSKFCLEKFSILVNYLSENSFFNNSNIIRDFEFTLIKNLNKLDTDIKIKAIVCLAGKVTTQACQYDDQTWETVLNDFLSQISVTFEYYYHMFNALESVYSNIMNKLEKMHADHYQFPLRYSQFLSKDNTKFFNNCVALKSIEDVFLLSKLIHGKLLNLTQINDKSLIKIDDIVSESRTKMVIKTGIILPCILVLHQELNGKLKTSIIFKKTITVLNEHLYFIFYNYDFLESQDRQTLENLSDNLFYYTYIFMSNENQEVLFPKVFQSYFNRIKSDQNVNWLNEIRLLLILAQSYKISNTEFWDEVFTKLRMFVLSDFDEAVRKIHKPQVKRISDKKSRNSPEEKPNHHITGLFYIGLMLELASKTTKNPAYWEFIIDLLRKHSNFRQKDFFFNIQFAYFHCHNIYDNSELEYVWQQLVPIFTPKLKRLLVDREVTIFFMHTLFVSKSVDALELSKIMTKVFLQTSNEEIREKSSNENQSTKLANIELFCVIYELLDSAIRVNNSVVNNKIMGNTFVDLLKIESSLFVGSKVKSLIEKMNISSMDLFKETVYERIKSLILEDPADSNLLKVIIVLNKSGLLSEIELSRLLYVFEKNDSVDTKECVSLLSSLLNK